MTELEEHRRYIADSVRLEAFSRAITQVLKSDDLVLDLGSGTGILGLLACRAGARHVYAVDAGSIVGLARELAHVNGFGDRLEIIREYSEWVRLPERVDLVICDQIGRVGVDAGLRQYMIDARVRLAKPDATLIPRAIELWFAPCEQRELRNYLQFWGSNVAGFTWEPVHRLARSAAHPGFVAEGDLLSAPARLTTIDLTRDDGTPIRGTVRVVVERSGIIDALAGWFRAELADDVWMSNSPVGERIDRRLTLMPVDPPMQVHAGDTVTADIRIDTESTGITWTLVARSNDRELQRVTRSTFEGLLLSAEDLDRVRTSAPRLSGNGTLRKQVLQLCDGHRSQHEIEAALYEYNREAFSSPAAAARFVADVLAQDAE